MLDGAAGAPINLNLAQHFTEHMLRRALRNAVFIRVAKREIFDDHGLVIIDPVGPRLLELYRTPVGVHLVGEQHGKDR